MLPTVAELLLTAPESNYLGEIEKMQSFLAD
jgi:hypothetical protein